MNGITKFFAAVAKPFVWLGKEIGKGLGFLPHLIALTNDAEKAGAECLPKVITVIEDAGKLAHLTANDSAPVLQAFAELGAAISHAATHEGLDLTADKDVIVAINKLVSVAKNQNYADALAAWHQVVTDVHDLDETVLADLQKLKADLAPAAQ